MLKGGTRNKIPLV